MITKEFTITYKDYMPVMAHDIQLNRSYTDVEYGYGKLKMTGTEEEMSAFIKKLRKESPGINIIGITNKV